MKIIITEEQNKKLFIPRRLDNRDSEFLKLIGFETVIKHIQTNGEIEFSMFTHHDDWDWEFSHLDDVNYTANINDIEKPVRDLLMNIISQLVISDNGTIISISGIIRLTDNNELDVDFEYNVTRTYDDKRTYKL
jgi:hypothetical protein